MTTKVSAAVKAGGDDADCSGVSPSSETGTAEKPEVSAPLYPPRLLTVTRARTRDLLTHICPHEHTHALMGTRGQAW